MENQSFTSADAGMTEVNTTDIMLELYSILLMVINALLLGDRQCQLPLVCCLCGCAWASAQEGEGPEEGSNLLPPLKQE